MPVCCGERTVVNDRDGMIVTEIRTYVSKSCEPGSGCNSAMILNCHSSVVARETQFRVAKRLANSGVDGSALIKLVYSAGKLVIPEGRSRNIGIGIVRCMTYQANFAIAPRRAAEIVMAVLNLSKCLDNEKARQQCG